jgi:exopolysaccharide production protein ExoQ
MSASTFAPPTLNPYLSAQPATTTWWLGLSRTFWYATLAIGLGVFMNEHKLSFSQMEDFAHGEDALLDGVDGGNMLRRLTFFWLGGVGLVLFYHSFREPWRIKPFLALTFCLPLIWSWTSILWSIDPSMCLRRLIVRTCCAVAMIGIGRMFTMREICWLAAIVLGGCIGVGVLAEIGLGTFRPWSGDYRFSGTQHPNPQGMYLAAWCFASSALVLREKRHRWLLVGCAFAGLVLLVLTKSRSATAALVITAAAVLLLQTTLRFKLVAGLSGGWLLAVAILVVWLSQIDALRQLGEAALMGRKEESDTLSGRNFIWPLASYFVSKHPWLGHGFESFWTADHVQYVADELQFPVVEAHNGYLEVMLSTGRIGLGLHLLAVFAGIASSSRSLWKTGDVTYGFVTAVLIYSLLSACFESTMFGIFFVTLVAWAGMAHLAFGGREEASESQPSETTASALRGPARQSP